MAPRMSKLYSRKSTIGYEIGKDLAGKPTKLSAPLERMRAEILNLNGCCEYCGVKLNNRSKNKGDHFYPLMKSSLPTEYCNDYINIIPACSTCNSSKSGTHWIVWLNSNVEGNPARKLDESDKAALIDKFERYDAFMQKYCLRKRIDENLFRVWMQGFQTYCDSVQNDIDTHSAVTFYRREELPDDGFDQLSQMVASLAL